MNMYPIAPLKWSGSVVLFLFSADLKADTTRVLFIGNSYTYSNDLPAMFRLLALSMGDTVETAMVAPGGTTFAFHASNPVAPLSHWPVVESNGVAKGCSLPATTGRMAIPAGRLALGGGGLASPSVRGQNSTPAIKARGNV